MQLHLTHWICLRQLQEGLLPTTQQEEKMNVTPLEIIKWHCKAMGPVRLNSIKRELRLQYAGKLTEEQVLEFISQLCEQEAIEEYDQGPGEVPKSEVAWW